MRILCLKLLLKCATVQPDFVLVKMEWAMKDMTQQELMGLSMLERDEAVKTTREEAVSNMMAAYIMSFI